MKSRGINTWGIYTWTSFLDETPGYKYLDFPPWWNPDVYIPGLPSLMKLWGIYQDFPLWWHPDVYIPGLPSLMKPLGIYTWTSLLDETPGCIYLDFPPWWNLWVYIPGLPSLMKPRGVYTWTSLLDETPRCIYMDFPPWWNPGLYTRGLPSLMKPRVIYTWTSFLDETPEYIYLDFPLRWKPGVYIPGLPSSIESRSIYIWTAILDKARGIYIYEIYIYSMESRGYMIVWRKVEPYLSYCLDQNMLTTYLWCLVEVFFQQSGHSYEYKQSSSSRRLVPLFAWGPFHTEASHEKRKEATPIL